jgi:peptidyl-prolyl cis-trans isomerase D
MKEVTPASPMPFEKVRDEVETRWRASERETRLASVVKKIDDGVKAGKPLKNAVAPFGRAPVVETVNRRAVSEILSEALLDQIFSAAKGAVVSGPANAGEAQIVAVIETVAFDESRVGGADLGAFAQFVGQQLDQELVEAYANAVRSDVGVKIRQTEIDALFSGTQ